MTTSMHWARWGDPDQALPLSGAARGLIEQAFGPVEAATVIDELAAMRLPPARLDRAALHALRGLLGGDHVLLDDESRVRHTRGRSTPDLLKLRTGDATDAPDAVLRPGDHEAVLAVLETCSLHGVAVVPYGGGTSVVGGLVAARQGFAGVVALDLVRLDRLVSVDVESATAVLEAGVRGPAAEDRLAEHGLTIGHFPQSYEYATVGGFAATRSSGQASLGYGRFDALVVGLRVATPLGTLELGSAPASAAGPDLRQLVLGSEGAFGVITAVTVRVRRRPPVRSYSGWRLATFREGTDTVRRIVQSDLHPTVLRLSDEAETFLGLAEPDAVGAPPPGNGGCLMITGYEGEAAYVDAAASATARALRECGAEHLGEASAEAWVAGRFRGPYLRDSLLDLGVLVETVETATFWSRVQSVYDEVRAALTTSLTRQGTPPIVLCHVSHAYPTGASLYFTVAARQAADPVAQWMEAKSAASDAIVAAGATISHHHAVGRDHRPWLAAEIGPVGVEILRAVKERLDPAGILNPGVLIP